jgi:hypothetical protein
MSGPIDAAVDYSCALMMMSIIYCLFKPVARDSCAFSLFVLFPGESPSASGRRVPLGRAYQVEKPEASQGQISSIIYSLGPVSCFAPSYIYLHLNSRQD